MNYFKRIFFLLFLLFLSAGVYALYWNSGVSPVTFVFTADGYGHILPSKALDRKKNTGIGGFSVLNGCLSQLKKPYILTDSGDVFQGTPEGVLTRGKIVIDLMNMSGYDAAAIGNHEFDYGKQTFKELAELADFPFLGTNIRTEELYSVPGYLKKYLVKTVNGVNVILFGTAHPEMEKIAVKENIEGLVFEDAAVSLNAAINEINSQGVDCGIIVLLSHMGIKNDMETLSKAKEIDVVLSGHYVSELEKPLRKDRKIICYPGGNFRKLGYLRLYYSKKEKKILSFYHKLIPLYTDMYPSDPRVDERISRESKKISREFEKVIGSSKVMLSRHLSGDERKHGELALGNWQTDIMRQAFEADFAFNNTDSIRGSIPAGNITIRDIWQLSPFGYSLVTMTLKGSEIKELLEQSVSREYSRLQMSGLKVVYNDSLPPGQRVLNIIVETAEGEKAELDPEEEYSVVTNSYLYRSGDGYTVFSRGRDVTESSVLLRDLEIEFIKKNSPIYAKTEKRLLNVSLENTGE